MSLSVRCPGCAKSYKVPEEKAGKKFKCAACGGIVAIPAEEVVSWDEAADEESEEELYADLPQRTPSRASDERPRKKSASSRKTLLWIGIAAGACVLLASIGVGGYFALRSFMGSSQLQFGSGASAYSVNVAWIPADLTSVYVLQPKKFFESDFVRTFDPGNQIVGGTYMRKEFVESLELMIIPELGRSTYVWSQRDSCQVMILHFTTPMDARERLKGMLKVPPPMGEWKEATAGGKTYWLNTMPAGTSGVPGATGSPLAGAKSETAFYSPDDRTIVMGNDRSIKKILTESYKSTPLRSLLGKTDFKNEIMVLGVSNTGDEPNAISPGEFALADSLKLVGMVPGIWRTMLQAGHPKLKSISVGVSGSGANLCEMTYEAKDAEAADGTERSFQGAKSGLENVYKSSVSDRIFSPEVLALNRKLLEGLTIEKTGNTVRVTLKKPDKFDTEVASLAKKSWEHEQQAQQGQKQPSRLPEALTGRGTTVTPGTTLRPVEDSANVPDLLSGDVTPPANPSATPGETTPPARGSFGGRGRNFGKARGRSARSGSGRDARPPFARRGPGATPDDNSNPGAPPPQTPPNTEK